MCILYIAPTHCSGSTFVSMTSYPTEPGQVEEQCRPVDFLYSFLQGQQHKKKWHMMYVSKGGIWF